MQEFFIKKYQQPELLYPHNMFIKPQKSNNHKVKWNPYMYHYFDALS